MSNDIADPLEDKIKIILFNLLDQYACNMESPKESIIDNAVEKIITLHEKSVNEII